MALLKITNLEKSYKISALQTQEVLKGVNIEFRSGEMVAILGESGCGKSTLINIIGGLDNDYTGSIIIKGDFIRDFTEEQMNEYRKQRVGLIFQSYNLINKQTILENIELSMVISNIDEKTRKQRAKELLDLVGLGNYPNKYPTQLSGGQKQRVAIARALANNPTVILADEPTGALDKESAKMVMDVLRKIADSGKLVILVTHSQKVAEDCNRIVTIDDGVVVSDIENRKIHVSKERDKEIIPKKMRMKDILKLSWKNVCRNKGRSLLVSIGTSIGIAAVILILCLSTGLTNYVNALFSSDSSAMQITVTKEEGKTFTESELETVSELSGVSYYENCVYLTSATCKDSDLNSYDVSTVYSIYNYFSPTIKYGTLPSDGGIIISSHLASQISLDISTLIGTNITLKYGDVTNTFEISGIYDDNTYDEVYISQSDMANYSLKKNIIYLQAEDSTYLSAISESLENMGFTVTSTETEAEDIISYIDMGTGVLSGVTGIAMVVSAIMIFIVLYISVVERMKEIGIMRAIGSSKKEIRQLFLFEASYLGFAAGIIGCIIALILSIITNVICKSSLECSIISYTVWYYLIGLIASVGISIMAGISPAIYASNLDPIESLRSE